MVMENRVMPSLVQLKHVRVKYQKNIYRVKKSIIRGDQLKTNYLIKKNYSATSSLG